MKTTDSYQHILRKIYAQTTQPVTVMAVSKRQPPESIRKFIAAGGQHVGENQLQEALPKIVELKNGNIIWHFIGTIQRNKTRKIAEHFAWVDSLAEAHIADRLNEQRPTNLPPLNVCIQVNIDTDSNKSGVAPEQVTALTEHIQRLPRLKLRGLMTVLAKHNNHEQTLYSYQRMTQLFIELQRQGFQLDTLSMGMSDDYLLAVQAGATMVRIGAALFGDR